jgi:hypothetical protein
MEDHHPRLDGQTMIDPERDVISSEIKHYKKFPVYKL